MHGSAVARDSQLGSGERDLFCLSDWLSLRDELASAQASLLCDAQVWCFVYLLYACHPSLSSHFASCAVVHVVFFLSHCLFHFDFIDVVS